MIETILPFNQEDKSSDNDNNNILKKIKKLLSFSKKDPLEKAKLRGLEIKEQLIEESGGRIKHEDIEAKLGISPEEIDKLHEAGKLIAIKNEKYYVCPSWQFVEPGIGTTIEGLEQVLTELKDFGPWMQLAFMLDPNLRLGEKTPLEVLRSDNIENVLVAARIFGEHGAE